MLSNKTLPVSVNMYFNKFAYNNWQIENDTEQLFDNVVVIPSLAELELLPNCINSFGINNPDLLNNTLLLVVVNNSSSAKDEIKQNNQQTIDYLKSYKGKLNLSYIDASTTMKAVPDKLAGVGMARKIGCDLALTKFNYTSSNKKIIYFPDADCIVSKDYLEKINNEFNRRNLHSAVVEYEHRYLEDTPEAEAIICYEIFLRYLSISLRFTNSYYRYHTIGSTITCTAEAYIKAGGMNKKKAGEDFYFIEKLAKQNKITTITEALVFPTARKSWRVPFGTGQRITRHLDKRQDEFVAYNPKIFLILKRWLEVFMCEDSLDSNQILMSANNIELRLNDFLIKNNFNENWNKILKNNTSISEIQKQKIFWFDSFRTLKLIHYLRDNGYPNVNLFDAVDKILEFSNRNNPIKRAEPIPKINIQKEYLVFLRKILREDY